MAKKYSRSQEIGASGEAAFKKRALRVGLIATKVNEDVGVDFWCQLRGPFANSVASVSGAIIGACVRTTESKDRRIALTRDDVEQALISQFPVIVALVTIDKSGDDRVYLRTLDATFVDELIDFFYSGRSSISFTPKSAGFVRIDDATEALSAIVKPGAALDLTIRIQTSRVRQLLPSAKIVVRLGETGPQTVVFAEDVSGAFDLSGSGELQVLNALFGPRSLVAGRLSSIAPNPNVASIMNNLPQPIALIAPAANSSGVLVASNEDGEASVLVEVRRAAGWLAFIHESGFNIRISEAREHEGQYLHFIDAMIDPDTAIELSEHEQLRLFLIACRRGAELRAGKSASDSTRMFAAENSSDLLRFSAFAWAYTQLVPEHRNVLGKLSTIPSTELLNGALFWADASSGKFEADFEWGFSLVDTWSETDQLEEALLPVCFNMHDIGIVVWLRSKVVILRVSGQICGLKIFSSSIETVEQRGERFKKASDHPEMVVCRDWAAIQFCGSEPTGTRDVTSWNCQMLRTHSRVQ